MAQMEQARRLEALRDTLARGRDRLDSVLSAEDPDNDEVFSAAHTARDGFAAALDEIREALDDLTSSAA